MSVDYQVAIPLRLGGLGVLEGDTDQIQGASGQRVSLNLALQLTASAYVLDPDGNNVEAGVREPS
jgi:hypothetical protein